MHAALLIHLMDYTPGNMTETWMTSIDSMLTKDWNCWYLDSTLFTRTSHFYIDVLHWNCAYWNFKPHLSDYNTMDFDSKYTVRSNWLFRKWWVQILFTTTRLWYKNMKYIKMASNKNAQNLAPRDLKRTNYTLNLPLVFTIFVYIVSGETLKVFFVTKFRVFYYLRVTKQHVNLHMLRRVGTGGKSGIHSVIIGNQNKIFKHQIAQFHY